MNVKKLIIAFICVLSLFNQNTEAQKIKRQLEYSGFFDSYYFRGPVAITVGIGMVGYKGDLCGGLACNTLKPIFSLGANYKVWPRVRFGAELSYFQLQAKDTSLTRNISFKSTNFELDLYGRFYFLDDIVRVASDRSKKPRRLKPYVSLGIGGLLYNPTNTYTPIIQDSGAVQIAYSDSTFLKKEARMYPGIALVIPVGLGLSYSFSHRVSLMGELSYKYAFSDYLDGVGAVRGTATGLKDSYYMFQLKLQLAPWAPKVKRKKKYKGQAPADNGGGTESPNTPTEKPKADETAPDSTGATTPQIMPSETPAGEAPLPETPPSDAPAKEVPLVPETPAPVTPAPENDGWGDAPEPKKKAGKK